MGYNDCEKMWDKVKDLPGVNTITVDTKHVHHIDVDFEKDSDPHPALIEFINELKEIAPYYLSKMKNMPHILFKVDKEFHKILSSQALHKCKKEFKREGADIEIMSSQGSWIDREKDTIYNPIEPPLLTREFLEKFFIFPDTTIKTKKMIKKTIKKKGKTTGGLVPVEKYTEDQKYYRIGRLTNFRTDSGF